MKRKKKAADSFSGIPAIVLGKRAGKMVRKSKTNIEGVARHAQTNGKLTRR